MRPYWAPTLVRLNQNRRAHLLSLGRAGAEDHSAFTGRYAGGETHVPTDVLKSLDPRIQLAAAVATATPKTVTLGVAEVSTPSSSRTPQRRAASARGWPERSISVAARADPDEVDQVNAALGGQGAGSRSNRYAGDRDQAGKH